VITPARLARWLALSGLLALVACGDDREPLVVAAASGARVDLTGTTWEICLEDAPGPGRSERFREVHGEDGAVTSILESYVGPGCTGETDGPARAGSAVARARGDVVVPWGGGPPPEGLDPPPPATRVEFESGGFIVGRDVYLVNDTGPRRALHTGVPEAPRDGAGYPTLLLSQGALEP
jgi:hypothetical protein